MLDVRQLAVLREVARAGSFAGAARTLGCSAQAVGQRVARLEAEAGVALVLRTRSGAALTDAGRALVRRAGRVLDELDRAERELTAAAGAVPVRVGSVRSGWYHTELATEFAAATGSPLHPVVIETPAGLRELRAGRLDALLGAELDLVPAARQAGLVHVDLVHEPVWLACSPAHPAAGHGAIDLGDLRDVGWLAQPPGAVLRRYLIAACRAAGFEPRIVHTADSWDLLDPLHQGVGVTLCAPIVVPDERLVTRPVTPLLRRTLYATWRADHPSAAALSVLPQLARRLYLAYVRQVPAYEAWLAEHPDALPPLPGGPGGVPPVPGGPGDGWQPAQKQVRAVVPTPDTV